VQQQDGPLWTVDAGVQWHRVEPDRGQHRRRITTSGGRLAGFVPACLPAGAVYARGVRGLLRRLSALDPGAESAVRIIDFFDGLTRNRANYEALVRAAAGLADCATGMRDNGGKVLAYFDAKGRPIPATPPEEGLVERSFGSSTSGGAVWLERPGGAEPLDEMLLERMAVAADIILDRRRGSPESARDDLLLVRTLVNARSRDVDKTDAARGMGLTGDVLVLAARLVTRDSQRLLRLARSLEHDLARPVRAAAIDETTAAVVVDAAAAEALDKVLERSLTAGDRVGTGPRRRPQQAHLSWRAANQALVFAAVSDGSAVVHSVDLGPLLPLASLSRADLVSVPDVVALGCLAESRGGPDVIATVECLVATGSLRQVSTAMHLHHSSIASRIRRAEEALGFGLISQDGLFRARLAIQIWRIARFDAD
jgi:PucR C-terminal helix-turn-helix domain